MLCVGPGFWDMLGLSRHVNGILLYHVLLGGHDVPALLRSGTDNTLLGLSLAAEYNLSFMPPDDPSFTVRLPNGPQPVEPNFLEPLPPIPRTMCPWPQPSDPSFAFRLPTGPHPV
jgi:hypothetical protein